MFRLGLARVAITAGAVLLFGQAISSQAVTAAGTSGVWYVALTGDDDNTCSDPASPCATINTAINKAVPGDKVYVARGVYTSMDPVAVVSITKSLALSGGWDSAFTVQDGMSSVHGEDLREGIRVFGAGPVTLDHLRIEHAGPVGYAGLTGGSGLRVYSGTVTLTDSAIQDSDTALILGDHLSWVQGSAIIRATTVTGNRHGLVAYCGNHLIVEASTVVADYSAAYPGATIGAVGARLTLTRSIVTGTVQIRAEDWWHYPAICRDAVTISDTSIQDSPAVGLWLNTDVVLSNSSITGHGGHGIYFLSDCRRFAPGLAVNNSTISDNGGYGLLVEGGDTASCGDSAHTTLSSSLIAGNALGGLANESAMDGHRGIRLRNTIIAGNTVPAAEVCHGAVSSLGYNLLGVGPTEGGCVQATTGDQIGANPALSWLLGSTYHALLPGSPAIDRGNPAGCVDHLDQLLLSDQRGVSRVGRCDIGPYEYDPAHDPLRHSWLPALLNFPPP
jgi:hypothetical protein